ncbi:DUF1993 domain-containing protein [Paraglaciecola aquimarina]|uniref:DUF1993 domain-containing protein n=1 Tax=Paraglaciecola algarum TaxID=3050085 RepID=A0ABS9D0Z6_9ALTE|nr:DUF1993 domain-containing protein [Paraglaciecola sp. G1-23]MCF2946604.1 DUF1993 domain-containing protein [Paraglaciecola sp. G1-23]
MKSLHASELVKPVVKQYLGSLSGLIDKAQAFCEEKGIDESVLLQARLAPNMHPLIWQFQMVSEFALRCTSRLADVDVPNCPFEEKSFSELKSRIAGILVRVDAIDDEDIDAGLERIQTVPLGSDKTIEFVGPIYLSHFFLPNFFFHITTAYNILRHNGVPLGKFDFIGSMPTQS